MKRLILFRYHKRFRACYHNVRWIKKQNPGIKVVGMFGGDPDSEIPQYLLDELDDNYILPMREGAYKWQNGDLCILDWFKNQGRVYDFDLLNIIEWDLFLTVPLAQIYSEDSTGIYLTRLHDYASLSRGWDWMILEQNVPGWQAQVAEAMALFGPVDLEKFKTGIFPATQMPRAFLERYADINPAPLTNDEARVGLYALAMGFDVRDTHLGVAPNIFEANDYDKINVTFYAKRIRAGATALHPVRTRALMKKCIRTKRFPLLSRFF